jgi:hypothetical protein
MSNTPDRHSGAKELKQIKEGYMFSVRRVESLINTPYYECSDLYLHRSLFTQKNLENVIKFYKDGIKNNQEVPKYFTAWYDKYTRYKNIYCQRDLTFKDGNQIIVITKFTEPKPDAWTMSSSCNHIMIFNINKSK